jgi:hypothetical protein
MKREPQFGWLLEFPLTGNFRWWLYITDRGSLAIIHPYSGVMKPKLRPTYYFREKIWRNDEAAGQMRNKKRISLPQASALQSIDR